MLRVLKHVIIILNRVTVDLKSCKYQNQYQNLNPPNLALHRLHKLLLAKTWFINSTIKKKEQDSFICFCTKFNKQDLQNISASCLIGIFVFVWSQYDGGNIEQSTIGYGCCQNQRGQAKDCGRRLYLDLTNKIFIQPLRYKYTCL